MPPVSPPSEVCAGSSGDFVRLPGSPSDGFSKTDSNLNDLNNVLTFFPDDTYHQLPASSESALICDDKLLVHRMVILREAAGPGCGLPAYIMGSLLSEGQVRYQTVDATPEGCRPRRIESLGSTRPIVTTTVSQLDKELETGPLTLLINADAVRTRSIMVSIAVGAVNGSGAYSR